MKYKAVVFDLFGTLLDVGSIAVSVSRFFPQKGDAVAALWRDKQIQYPDGHPNSPTYGHLKLPHLN